MFAENLTTKSLTKGIVWTGICCGPTQPYRLSVLHAAKPEDKPYLWYDESLKKGVTFKKPVNDAESISRFILFFPFTGDIFLLNKFQDKMKLKG